MSVIHKVECDWCRVQADLVGREQTLPPYWDRVSHDIGFGQADDEDLCPDCVGMRKAVLSDALSKARAKAAASPRYKGRQT